MIYIQHDGYVTGVDPESCYRRGELMQHVLIIVHRLGYFFHRINMYNKCVLHDLFEKRNKNTVNCRILPLFIFMIYRQPIRL